MGAPQLPELHPPLAQLPVEQEPLEQVPVVQVPFAQLPTGTSVGFVGAAGWDGSLAGQLAHAQA